MSTTSLIFSLSAVIILGLVIWLTIQGLHKKHHERLRAIESINQEVETAFADIRHYFSYNHYITESERNELLDKYSALYNRVADLIKSKELNASPHASSFHRLYSALTNTYSHKQTNNQHFIENQLAGYSGYFDSILSHPLDQQQREAIVSLEDNVLVISSAGSGKTMTTVGKVRYLIDIQKVNPEKILLITFTRKAAESLSERLHEKNLKCRTFHKLAVDIIAESTGRKPSLTQQDFSVQVYHNLFKGNSSFNQAIADYIIRSRYKMKDQFEYASLQEYMYDRQKYGIQAFFPDMDGRPVFCKSDEESKICDFLGSRGIKYKYEARYEFDTVEANYRQYCPDFSIYYTSADGSQKRIYLEHYAINEHNQCPAFFSDGDAKKYLNSIAWKRQLHKEKGTILLETTSAGFHRGDVFNLLSKQLSELGVVFKSDSFRGMSRELQRQEESILNMLTAFNFLLKSRNITIESIRKQVSKQDRITLNDIVIPFIEEYQRLEEERNEIDFTDAIIQATDLCNNGHRPDYDYILVDEFQDISLDRYRFLQSLRRATPLTKLFCVGDDWQSIYRFAGSDMALFKHFEKYFGYTKRCLMETTYRFGEPAIEWSSNFILANPEQAIKKVHSFKTDSETQLYFCPTNGTTNIIETIKGITDHIAPDKDIMFLGRYGFDINVFKDSDLIVHSGNDGIFVVNGTRRMQFMTVHQAKGLECDYIILLNCNGGTMGFPADIADSSILKYVLSEPDAYAFSEERRVFYVGITRARKKTWVLYDQNKPSPFVKEFVTLPSPGIEPVDSIPANQLCPKCHCGRVKIAKKGIAKNGNPYSVLVCSNERFGCDYQETVFVNLNKQSRNSRYRSTKR